MNLNTFALNLIKLFAQIGIIPEDKVDQAEKALETLFSAEDDPNAGEDTLNFSPTAADSFKATAGDDAKLDLDELKKRAQDYLSKYATEDEKTKYGPMMGIFLDENNKVDEDLFKKLAGEKGHLTAEDIKKLDSNGDGRVTKEEVAAFKKANEVSGGTKSDPENNIDSNDKVDGENPEIEGDGNEIVKEEPKQPTQAELKDKAFQEAMKDATVKSLQTQVDKALEEAEKLSATMQSNSTVADAIKTLQNFNALIGKMASATSATEVNNILNQIKNQAGAIASAQKVVVQAAEDDAKQVYNDPIAGDVNSLLSKMANQYQDWYTNDEVRQASWEKNPNKNKEAIMATFKKEITAILNNMASALRKELKEQLGSNYNAAEAENYIQAAMTKTIDGFVNGAYQLARGDGKDAYTMARGKNAIVYEPKGDGKSNEDGRWTYSVKSLMDNFMANYKAAVSNTPTQQLTDAKAKAEQTYQSEVQKNDTYRSLQYGGMLFDKEGSPIRDRNGNTLDIYKYMGDYQKKEVQDNLTKMEEKQRQVDELIAKMRKATTTDEANGYQKQLNSLYQEIQQLRSTIQRHVGDAWYRYNAENQQNSGYNYGYTTPTQEPALLYSY